MSLMGILAFGKSVIDLTLKIWEAVDNRPRKKLMKQRDKLEEESRQAQIDGDVDELRRIRGEIEEIDKVLSRNDSRNSV